MEAVEGMASSLVEEGMAYIEVPNGDDIMREHRFYDFFYEHVSYFKPSVLDQMLKRVGLSVVSQISLVGGQHFGTLARKTHAPSSLREWSSGRIDEAESFAGASRKMLSELGETFSRYTRVAIYGGGNHTMLIASMLDLSPDRVEVILDGNRLKAGHYSPGTHIPIRHPYTVNLSDLEAIVIIASLHQSEIHQFLRGEQQFAGDVIGIYPEIHLMEGPLA
jgi:hypothetical protein